MPEVAQIRVRGWDPNRICYRCVMGWVWLGRTMILPSPSSPGKGDTFKEKAAGMLKVIPGFQRKKCFTIG